MLLTVCSFKYGFSQSIITPKQFFNVEKPTVLMVGTFHLNYPNLEYIKTDDSNKIDVIKEPKRSEITEVVNYIKKFRPTRIAIEAFPDWTATDKLRKYKNGEYKNERDERYQLGLRIAAESKLDTIYSINAESFDNDLSKRDSTYISSLFTDYDFESSDKYELMFKKWMAYDVKLPSRTNLLRYLKYMNSRESHRLGYGAYLIGDFKLDDTRGADVLSIWWYNRNLRIFRKIQQINYTPDDRILIIIGNGHAAILRQLLESSPEFEFVEFDSLGK
jgi:hypothetical protein